MEVETDSDHGLEPDPDVDAFMLAAREKHREFWAVRPARIPGVDAPCKRCSGTGRAPSPAGHVRCSLCYGSGKDPEKWKQPTVTGPQKKRRKKRAPKPLVFLPGVKTP